jgi:hypothetical protein
MADNHLEQKNSVWETALCDSLFEETIPCSNLADFLYSNRTPTYPAALQLRLIITSRNIVEGVTAGCKGCALINDAVTTFKRRRLPVDNCEWRD